MRWVVLAVGVLLVAVSGVRPAVSRAQPDYREQIADALRRLRQGVADAAAWQDVNGGVRAALAVEDFQTAIETATTCQDLLKQLFGALGTGDEGVPAPDPSLAQAIQDVNAALGAAFDALKQGAEDAVRAAFARAQDAAQRQVDAAAAQAAAAKTGDVPVAVAVPALIQAGGTAAAVGLEPRVVQQPFADARELLESVTASQARSSACGSAAGQRLQAYAVGLGVDRTGALPATAACGFRGEGTARAELVSGSGGAGILRYTQQATFSITFETPPSGSGPVQGSGTAAVTVSYDFDAEGAQCRGAATGTVPIQVSGEAAGGTLKLRLTPGGEIPASFTCTFGQPNVPGASPIAPVTTQTTVTLPGTTGTIDLPAQDGAQGRLTEDVVPPAAAGAGGQFRYTVTWELRISRQP